MSACCKDSGKTPTNKFVGATPISAGDFEGGTHKQRLWVSSLDRNDWA